MYWEGHGRRQWLASVQSMTCISQTWYSSIRDTNSELGVAWNGICCNFRKCREKVCENRMVFTDCPVTTCVWYRMFYIYCYEMFKSNVCEYHRLSILKLVCSWHYDAVYPHMQARPMWNVLPSVNVHFGQYYQQFRALKESLYHVLTLLTQQRYAAIIWWLDSLISG